MVFGTSNGTVLNAVQAQGDAQFKTVNNLLSLQDNHVEEFFQYHGELFLRAFEQLMEDVTERVVSQMLSKLSFKNEGGIMTVNPDCLREYERITQENIELDIQKILATALNAEVINQRKMAKEFQILQPLRPIRKQSISRIATPRKHDLQRLLSIG